MNARIAKVALNLWLDRQSFYHKKYLASKKYFTPNRIDA